jgi:hypothetical protein
LSQAPPGIKERVIEAILRKIEGSKDLKKRLDYLMNPDPISSSSRLSEIQVQAVAETQWLGHHFPSLKPLADFTLEYAKWSISREGKGREEEVMVMISETKDTISALGLPIATMQQQAPGKEKEKGKGK